VKLFPIPRAYRSELACLPAERRRLARVSSGPGRRHARRVGLVRPARVGFTEGGVGAVVALATGRIPVIRSEAPGHVEIVVHGADAAMLDRATAALERIRPAHVSIVVVPK